MDSLVVTGGLEDTIRLWRLDTGATRHTFSHPNSHVNSVNISKDKRHLVAGGYKTVSLYDCQSGEANSLASFEAHSGNVTSVDFYPETPHQVFTTSDDGMVKAWDTRKSGSPTGIFSHDVEVYEAVMHPNEVYLYSCDEGGAVARWDLRNLACAERMIPEEGCDMCGLTISGSGDLLAACSKSGMCYVWESSADECHPLKMICAHRNEMVLKCKFSPTDDLLATASSDHSVKLWSVSRIVAEAASDSDGDGDDEEEQDDDEEMSPDMFESCLTGHGGWVWDMAFSQDGKQLVTVCSDKIGRMYSTTSQGVVPRANLELKGHQRGMTCIAINDATGDSLA
eukprot:m.353708 g.353708  ORF g.353708 m.353708 type:complete len:339 (-) comp16826_c0_seq1:2222-3238(-)